MNQIMLVDGQNVLRHGDGSINLRNLELLRKWAEKNQIEIKIVLPNSKKYITKIKQTKDILFINSHVYDDSALIQLALELDLPIISNDKFRDFRSLYPEFDFEGRVFSFDIILDVFITEANDYLRIVNDNFLPLST